MPGERYHSWHLKSQLRDCWLGKLNMSNSSPIAGLAVCETRAPHTLWVVPVLKRAFKMEATVLIGVR